MSVLTRAAGKIPHRWLMSIARLQYRHRWVKPIFELAANRVRNRDGEIQQGIGRGIRFNTGTSIAGYLLGTAEPDMQAALKSLVRPGMTVYDLGANVGFISMIAARLVGPDGHVVSFEPSPQNVRQIRHNASLNDFTHVIVREEAVGGEEGPASFELTNFPTTGRLEAGSLNLDKIGEMTVSVRRLDAVVAEACLPLPDLIKIDVEGAEVEALEGAAETLDAARPILLVEVHGTNRQVADALEELNYSSHVLFSRARVVDAHWNAHVLAVPAERRDLADIVSALTDPSQTP